MQPETAEINLVQLAPEHPDLDLLSRDELLIMVSRCPYLASMPLEMSQVLVNMVKPQEPAAPLSKEETSAQITLEAVVDTTPAPAVTLKAAETDHRLVAMDVDASQELTEISPDLQAIRPVIERLVEAPAVNTIPAQAEQLAHLAEEQIRLETVSSNLETQFIVSSLEPIVEMPKVSTTAEVISDTTLVIQETATNPIQQIHQSRSVSDLKPSEPSKAITTKPGPVQEIIATLSQAEILDTALVGLPQDGGEEIRLGYTTLDRPADIFIEPMDRAVGKEIFAEADASTDATIPEITAFTDTLQRAFAFSADSHIESITTTEAASEPPNTENSETIVTYDKTIQLEQIMGELPGLLSVAQEKAEELHADLRQVIDELDLQLQHIELTDDTEVSVEIIETVLKLVTLLGRDHTKAKETLLAYATTHTTQEFIVLLRQSLEAIKQVDNQSYLLGNLHKRLHTQMFTPFLALSTSIGRLALAA